MEEKQPTTESTGHRNYEEELRDEILAEEKFPEEKNSPHFNLGMPNVNKKLSED